MAANDETTTWETDQVTLWIDNDQGLYLEAPRCRTAADLADLIEPLLPAFGVDDPSAVDWDDVYNHVHADDETDDDEIAAAMLTPDALVAAAAEAVALNE